MWFVLLIITSIALKEHNASVALVWAILTAGAMIGESITYRKD
ncbi:hypothetical protein P9257_05185 [Bacillus velezensis]|nr:hypothetical protein [Bacillus velezensis]